MYLFAVNNIASLFSSTITLVMASFGRYDYLFERYHLTGQWMELGDFDLCNTVRTDYKRYKAPFDAKYCLQNMVRL